MTDRRDFLKGVFRLTLFGGLAIGCVHLSLQEKTVATQDENCNGNGVCQKCPLLKKCKAPGASSFKEAVE